MKKRRNLPAHIVLPNGMWRFVKKGTKKAKIIRQRHHKGGVKMVRRSYRRHYSKAKGMVGGLVGKGSLMHGIVKPRGFLGDAVIGAGAAAVANEILGGEKFPMQSEAVGFLTGGVAGAAAVFAMKRFNLSMLQGSTVSGTSLY